MQAGDGTLSYRDLEVASASLAATLAELGIGPEDRVAVHGDLSPELLVAALGTLRAGAAFVPVAAGEAPERARRTLEAVGPRAVLATAGTPPPACLPPEVPVLAVGTEPGDFPPEACPRVEVTPANLAYVLFTSGSTGGAKGVAVEHGAIVSYLGAVSRLYALGGNWPLLPAVTRFGFDASLLQTFGPLSRGDPVWLLSSGCAEDPSALLAELAHRPGAGLHCVPSLWREALIAVEEGRAEEPRLAALLLGGEPVPPDLWDATRARFPCTALANVYGPTETTVQVTGGYQPPGEPLSAGRPLSGVTVRVLDERLRPVPPGGVGEVYIGGAQVARGYVGRPAATAEAFLPDPWGEPGARLHRSGDLGSWNQDGTLRIVGRRDRQVKVRGFRIELGEVEVALAGHPDVAATIAVGAELGTPRARIRALAEPRPGRDLSLAALAEHAATLLPAHMRPAELEVVAALPRTPSGKLDREAATDPAPPAPPDDPLAAELATIWAEALDLPGVDLEADFFALGGHSLLVTRVIARTRRAVGAKVPMRALFDNPRLADFARAVAEQADGGEEAERIPRRESARAPLSLQQEELVEAAEALRGTPFGNVLLPLKVAAGVPAGSVEAALRTLWQRHAILRTVFPLEGAGRVQLAGDVGELPLARVAASSAPDRGAGAVARALYAESPSLVEGPLLRASLIEGDEGHLLLLRLHHLACDGLSLRLLAEELAELLTAERASSDPPPPRTDLTYGDFAAWQRRRWESGAYQRELDFWRERLSPLAAAEPPATARSFRFETSRAAIPIADWERWKRLCSGLGATPFMAFAAALAIDFASRGRERTRLATIVGAREQPELEAVVGPFANTVLIAFEAGDDPTAAELLAGVRRRALDAYAHSSLPFDLVVGELGLVGPLGVDVGFHLEPERPPPGAAGPLEALPVGAEGGGGMFVPSGLPLTVIATPSRLGLEVAVEYEEGRLAGVDADELPARLLAITGALLEAPRLRLSELCRRGAAAAGRVAGAIAAR